MTQQRVAVFPNPTEAQQAIRALRDAGIADDHISVILADSGDARQLLESGPGSEGEAARLGATVGGTLWGLAAVGLALTPIGVIAAGPVVAGLAGAGAGAVSGGLLGALVGKGIPEKEAVLREREIADGGVMVLVDFEESSEDRTVSALRSAKTLHEFTI